MTPATTTFDLVWKLTKPHLLVADDIDKIVYNRDTAGIHCIVKTTDIMFRPICDFMAEYGILYE